MVRSGITNFKPRSLKFILRSINRIRSTQIGIAFPWLAAALCLGAVRYIAVLPVSTINSLSNYNDLAEQVILEGIIIDPPDVRDGYTNLVIQATHLRLPEAVSDLEVEGRLLARLDPGKIWRYGEHVRLMGYLYTPNETEIFSYRDYLAQRNIFSQMRVNFGVHLNEVGGNFLLSGLYTLRSRGLKVLQHIYPDPEAALLAGILLGVEQYIPEDVNSAFQITGTSHIIAISG